MKRLDTRYGSFYVENENSDLVPNWLMVYDGEWEKEIYPILEKYLDKEHSSIEVGSFIGEHTIYMSTLCKKVFAFEPFVPSYKLLCKNIVLNNRPNIEAHNKVILDGENVRLAKWGVDINAVQDGNTASTRFVSDPAGELKSYVLDNLIPNIPIGFIKTDAEGADLIVLESAKAIIKKYSPIIVFEYNSDSAICYGDNFSDYAEFFSNLGYKIEQLSTWNWLAVKE